MKSWRERVEQDDGRFQFGVACCGIHLAPWEPCRRCGRPYSLDEVLAAHGLVPDDLPCQPVVGDAFRTDTPS